MAVHLKTRGFDIRYLGKLSFPATEEPHCLHQNDNSRLNSAARDLTPCLASLIFP